MTDTLLNRLHRLLRPSRVAVVTPVGPGHDQLYRECRASIEVAWRNSRGPFGTISIIAVDDSAGSLGRSRARNTGIKRALDARADWLFFLDADDLITDGAFAAVAPFVADYDAVWGLILGLSPGATRPHLRVPQIVSMNTLDDLLLFDPFLTLQMGHFVRAPVAQAIGFDESLDAGEDFDYYLQLWTQYRCVKVAREFFINRHALHSVGPRAASAVDWGAAVRGRQRAAREQHGLAIDTAHERSIINKRVAEVQNFCRQHALVSADDSIALSAQMPYCGDLEVNEYEGGGLILHTENDDAICAQLAWTGEYRPFAIALWQALAASGGVILDVGSGNALFALLAARVAPSAFIFAFEPVATNAKRARMNVTRNGISNIKLVESAVTDTENAPSVLHIDDFIARQCPDAVALVRVAAGCAALAVLHGMERTLSARRPVLLVELADLTQAATVAALLQRYGYRCYVIDESTHQLALLEGLPRVDGAGALLATTDDIAGIKRLAVNAQGCLSEY